MSDAYLSFDGVVEPLEWGKATYTIVRLPKDIEHELAKQGAKRVEGEMNDHPVNLALTKAPVVEGQFLWAGKSLLEETGVVPGEVFEMRLRKADPDNVETPGDVIQALTECEALSNWEQLTPGKKRGHLYQINSAKRAETRAKRISKLAMELRKTP